MEWKKLLTQTRLINEEKDPKAFDDYYICLLYTSIVELMGGELQLQSEVGNGSEFYFNVTLPFGKPEENGERAALDRSCLLYTSVLIGAF